MSPSQGANATQPIWATALGWVTSGLNSAYSSINGFQQNYEEFQNAISKTLPDILYSAANNLAWFLQWDAKPVKVDHVKPEYDQNARKTILRYGPFSLMGQKVGIEIKLFSQDGD